MLQPSDRTAKVYVTIPVIEYDTVSATYNGIISKIRNNFLYRLDKAKKLQRLLVESPADLKPHKNSGVLYQMNNCLSQISNVQKQSQAILTSPMKVQKLFYHHQSTRHITVD